MAGSETKHRWVRVLQVTFAVVLCLLTPVALQAGLAWYWSVAVFCGAILIMVGQRRILRPGVSRTASEIVCRYIPWYEGNAYMVGLVLPLMGIAAIAAGRDPSNPSWVLPCGVIIVGVTPLTVYGVVNMWCRSLLCISTSALTLRLATRGSQLNGISRESVESINPTVVTNGMNRSLQVEIDYRPADSDTNTVETVLLGLQLTVRPIDLVNALMAWKYPAVNDPDELLDLIEQVLRGHHPTAPLGPPQNGSASEADRDVPQDDSYDT